MTLVLRCTGKLAKLLGLQLPSLEGGPDSNEWYGNIFWVEGRKCVLFTHSETLFSFVVPDVLKGTIVPLPRFFAAHVHSELDRENLPRDTFGSLDSESAVLAKTVDRSVLGSMNEFAYMSEVFITRAGGLVSHDPDDLNRLLRRTPMGALGYAFPIEKARERLARTV
jgi:hypothetical protein